MIEDPELIFRHELALALGLPLWQIELMPASEYARWAAYHKVRGLPSLHDLFARIGLVIAECHWSGKGGRPRLEDFYMRPSLLLSSPEEMVRELDRAIAGDSR